MQDPAGGVERGPTASEIKSFMRANFERAKDNRRWYDPLLMKGEWPVLLRIIGKGEGKDRYLSVAEDEDYCSSIASCHRADVERIESQPEVALAGVRFA